MINPLFYESRWTGSDTAMTQEAFEAGFSAAVDAIAQVMSDSPQSYEDAKSEADWRSDLLANCNQLAEKLAEQDKLFSATY